MEGPGKPLERIETTIPGLVLYSLPVHGDNRGWFKENWQREKMRDLGLPDFGPVQNNISFNAMRGTTRGIHAEPWDKFISVASGRIFGAWVDLREGESFGSVFTAEIDPSRAIYVPRGVGNAFQTLEPDTVYSYLVNGHWSSTATYTFLNLADETASIPWPIPLSQAELSAKDRGHPSLDRVQPVGHRRTLILGAEGQIGRALTRVLPNAVPLGRRDLDMTDPTAWTAFPWHDYDLVVNAAAFTNVDRAESEVGRTEAWGVNVSGVGMLARAAIEHRLTVVHISSDYVFDGTRDQHTEQEPLSPLGVYGQTKAAGDAIVATLPRHYIVRTSWVIGEGDNFVRAMASLAARDGAPTVVEDQWGRLSFADDVAAGIAHLLENRAEYGVYNLTNDGPATNWAEIARQVFAYLGHDPLRVKGVTTEKYFADRQVAPRPLNSVLSLDKIRAADFQPRDAGQALREYLRSMTAAESI